MHKSDNIKCNHAIEENFLKKKKKEENFLPCENGATCLHTCIL